MKIEISRVWYRELRKYKLEKNPFATIKERKDGDDYYVIAELEEKHLLEFLKWMISNTNKSVIIEDNSYFGKQEADLNLKIYDDWME